MTPDISAIAQKWAKVLEEACGHCCGDNIAIDADSLGNAMASYAAEATASLRAQHESEVATLRRSLLESANLLDKAEQRWIPVSERLPETSIERRYDSACHWDESEDVLVLYTDGKQRVALYIHPITHARTGDYWACASEGVSLYREDITHWRELPAAPRVAQESPLNGEKLETGKQ